MLTLSEGDLDPEAAWLAGPGCDPSIRRGLMLRLEPPSGWQQAEDPYEAVRPWLSRVEALFQARPDLARFVQLGRRPDRVFHPNAYAFLAEKVSTILRSIRGDASLVLGTLGAGAEEWLDTIDAPRLAPYLHGASLEEPGDLKAWMGRLAARFPALPVWLHVGDEGGGPATWLSRVREARQHNVRCVVIRAESDSAMERSVLALVRGIPARFILDPGPSGLESIAGAPLLELMDPLGPEKVAVLAPGPAQRVSLSPGPVSQTRASDLESGTAVAFSSQLPQGASGVLWIDLPETSTPLLLRYVPAQQPRGAAETVGVTEERTLTAEEIIAGLRAFEMAQERIVQHYRAQATISYHYRADALNESIDVLSVNRFYWKERVGEYEETSLYVNGARWHGAPPSLPFVSAETVKEVPLEIRLDQSYDYELKGESEVDGRPAWELAFHPHDPSSGLYSGAVWVHRQSFARLRLKLVQHALKEPITSKLDEIEYAPIEGAGVPQTVWLPVRGYRQMVFTVLGRAVAVERRVSWEEFSINAPGFDESRHQAYASGQPIMREDESGHSFRVRQPDGTYRVEEESLRNVALFGGLGGSTDGGVGGPFAGLNYFDFDWRGTGTQVDVAFAGVMLDVAWTDPALGKSPWELTVEGRVTAFPDRFKRVDGEGRRSEEDLEVLEQGLTSTLGRPVTSFSKAEVRLDLAYDNYGPDDDTDTAFVAPPTRPVGIATGRWRNNRMGWSTDVWFSAGHRFGWEDWGVPGSEVPGASGSADQDDFQRWGITLLKALYPSTHNRVSLGVTWQDGHGLDRFSRYRIGDFRNARVRGYNSYDVTFSRGVTGQAAWLTSLTRAGISLDLSLDGALIENDEDFEGYAWIAGGGAAVSWNGPWGTLLSARTGFGLGSSLDLGSSGFSIRLIMIKTWDRWPWGHQDRQTTPPTP